MMTTAAAMMMMHPWMHACDFRVIPGRHQFKRSLAIVKETTEFFEKISEKLSHSHQMDDYMRASMSLCLEVL